MPIPKDELDALDPIVRAALIDEDEEDAEITKRVLEQHDIEVDEPVVPPVKTDDEDEEDAPAKNDAGDKDDSEEIDEDEEPAKPTPADDDASDDDNTDAEAEKLSRKQKREARKQEFLEKIATIPEPKPAAQAPAYKPLDITEDSEYDPADLVKDREEYAKATAAAVAQRQTAINQEVQFWGDVEQRATRLYADPKYKFLDDKDTENFDEARASKINTLYQRAIGYKETIITDDKGYAKLDVNGQPVKQITTARKDWPYDEFVKDYIEQMDDYADDREAEVTKQVVQQRAHQGVRPGGSSRRGIGKLNVGDISKMSDEEYDANEAEIDRQINAELGIS